MELEILGPAGIYASHYSQAIAQKNNFIFGYKVGFSAHQLQDFKLQFNPSFKIPFGIWSGYQYKKSLVYGGTGALVNSQVNYYPITHSTKRNYYLNYYAVVGVSYQWHRKWRTGVAYTPVFNSKFKITHWGAIQIQFFL